MGDRTPVWDNAGECNPGEGWRKSSYSMSNGQCVEAARLPGGCIGVRDSKAAEGLVLRFEPEAWTAFLVELRTSPSLKNLHLQYREAAALDAVASAYLPLRPFSRSDPYRITNDRNEYRRTCRIEFSRTGRPFLLLHFLRPGCNASCAESCTAATHENIVNTV